MSTLYPDLNFTNFPNSLDNIALKSNITNATDSALVNQIQSAIISGDFITASNLLNNNPQLNGKIFTANDYNTLRDAILALENFYKNDISIYITEKQTEWKTLINQFNYKGAYLPTVQYYENNLVSYENTQGKFLYLCTNQPPLGTLPTNTTSWRVMTLRGERGETGIGGMAFTYLWNPSTQYGVNNIVVYSDKWWGALQANRGQIPMEGSQYWQVLISALPAIQIPIQSNQPTTQILGDQWYRVIN